MRSVAATRQLFSRKIQSMKHFVLMAVTLFSLLGFGEHVNAQCVNPANPIVAENCLTGNPASEWDISTSDAGDPTIQGFATDISVNQGGTVYFRRSTRKQHRTRSIYTAWATTAGWAHAR